jgi:Tol biopolymer transport system component
MPIVLKYINERELTQFDQVQDMKYMLDANTLILSAVKGGQSDIFVYHLDKERVEQITNDVYDDLDASYVAFPNKSGIVFCKQSPKSKRCFGG